MVKANPGGSFKGKEAGSSGWLDAGAFALPRGTGRTRTILPVVRRGPQPRGRQDDGDDDDGSFH